MFAGDIRRIRGVLSSGFVPKGYVLGMEIAWNARVTFRVFYCFMTLRVSVIKFERILEDCCCNLVGF